MRAILRGAQPCGLRWRAACARAACTRSQHVRNAVPCAAAMCQIGRAICTLTPALVPPTLSPSP
eukprot:7237862-Prymnesium_polylepis.1